MTGDVPLEVPADTGEPPKRDARGERRSHHHERGAIIGPRWRFLAEASEILDSSLEYTETLANVVRLAVPRLADAAVLRLLTPGGSLMWAASEHRDPARAALMSQLRAYELSLTAPNNLMAEAARTGKTQVAKTVDDVYLRSIAQNESHLALLRKLAPTSLIILPLSARGLVFGTLLLATDREYGRRYTDRDVVIAKEVGRRLALASDRALLFRAAEQAARTREEMVAVVSHDLKNPLSTIQMAVSFLLEDLIPDDGEHQTHRKQLHVIRRSAERMFRLVHDLLDVAAIEAGQLAVSRSTVLVDALVSDAMELLGPLAAAKHIALVVDTPPDVPPVTADPERILQVFSNLGGNAIKFTPQGGRVEIRVRVRDAEVEFAVLDSGSGIEPEDLPHVFDRFWQSKKARRAGAGLGLAIARGIVEAHEGRIRAESETGRGSCFSFVLPVAPSL